jgi:hypothetical protein
MMRRDIPASAVLALLAGAAVAQETSNRPPFRAIDYPLEVRKALSYAPEECRRQGGGKVTFAPDTVRNVDLNGDGRTDYVISLQDAECAGRQSVFCGTAGCSTDVLVTLPNGRIRNVFSDRIRGYEILPGKGMVRFELHGSYCGGSGNPSCFKAQRITGKPFEFKEPED